MKVLFRLSLLLAGLALIQGCEFKKSTSRDEIPNIKESIVAFEVAVKARHTDYLDSLMSSDAAEAGTTPQSILDFIYSDGLTEFVGFTHKQIFFRGNAARIDCKTSGPDGPAKDVTITMRKQGEVWLIKKIQERVDNGIKDDKTGT